MKQERYVEIKEGVKNSYNLAAREYHNLFGNELEDHDYDKKLLDEFSNCFTADDRICEMGCGPSAQIGRYLFKKGLNVDCLDFSENNIENAKSIEPGINYHCKDMTDSGLPNECYSGIVCFYTLFHIPIQYQHEVINEFYRLLKPNGILLIVNHYGLFRKTITEIWNHKDMKLYANFSRKMQLKRILIKGKYKIEKLLLEETYYGFPKYRIIAKAIKI